MAKLNLIMDGMVLQEVVLSKERITIGRGPNNDIVINNLAVSAVHAAIVTTQNDSYLEDLNSTNGTQINGQPVKKHFLRDNDVIELAKYKIKYFSDADVVNEAPDNLQNDVDSTATPGVATIKVLNGVNAGKEISLTKALTTIGKPGLQVAVVTQRASNYCITHIEGSTHPLINGTSIGAREFQMKDGDVIDLAGSQMVFRRGQL